MADLELAAAQLAAVDSSFSASSRIHTEPLVIVRDGSFVVDLGRLQRDEALLFVRRKGVAAFLLFFEARQVLETFSRSSHGAATAAQLLVLSDDAVVQVLVLGQRRALRLVVRRKGVAAFLLFFEARQVLEALSSCRAVATATGTAPPHSPPALQ